MNGGDFDDLTPVFDSMIDWRKRLSHEEAFYRELFSRVGVRRVVDVACGTGQHAAMFHSWGLQVEGADLSPNMIDRARAGLGEPAGLCWVVRGYDQPIASAKPFDAAVCVGNSLALAPDQATVNRALSQMMKAVRPGGVVVVHLLNLWALPDGPSVWQKSVRADLPDGPALIIKGVHRCGERAYIDLLVNDLAGDRPMRMTSVPFRGLEASVLERTMRNHGAARVHVYGGYRDQAYVRQQSTDLIMVAEK